MSVQDKIKYLITADSSKFRRELKEVGKRFDRFNRKNRYAIRRMKQLAVGAGAAGAAIGAAFAIDTVKKAERFEQALANAGAKANATAAEMDRMKKAAIDAGQKSAFSAKEAADGLTLLAQAGFSVDQQISSISDTLNLASSDELELAEAASIGTSAIKAFNLRASEMGRVADVLAKASASANTDVRQLGDGLGNAGGIAGRVNQSLESTVAVIAQMQDVGVSASEAGTAVRSALSKLAAVGGKASLAIEKIGVRVRNSNGKLRQFSDIVADMAAAGAEASDYVDAFGEKIGPKILSATAQGAKGLRDFKTALDQAGGAAKEMADRKLNTLNGQMKLLNGSWETLQIQLGSAALPMLTKVTRIINQQVMELNNSDEAFQSLEERINSSVDSVADAIEIFSDFITIGAYVAATVIEIGRALKVLAEVVEIALSGWQLWYLQITEGSEAAKARANELIDTWNDAVKTSDEWGDSLETAGDITDRLNELTDKAADAVRGLDDGMISLTADTGKAVVEIARLIASQYGLSEEFATAEDAIKSVGETFSKVTKGLTFEKLTGFQWSTGAEGAGKPVGGKPTGGAGAPDDAAAKFNTQAEAAKKSRDELKSFADTVNSNFAPATQKLDERLRRLGNAFSAGLIDMETWDKAVQSAFNEFDPATKKANALRESADKLMGRLSQLGNGQLAENLARLEQQFASDKITVDEYASGLKRIGDAADSFRELQGEAMRLKDSLRGPFQVAEAEVARYRQMLDQGLITLEQFRQAADRARTQAEEKVGKTDAQKQAEAWEKVWENAGNRVASTLANSVSSLFDALLSESKSVEDALKDIAKQFVMIAAKAAILKGLESAGIGSGIASAVGFASGGYVRGPGTSTSDSIPARLSNGEYVLQAPAVDQVGVGFLDAVNQGKVELPINGAPRRFASGGAVDSSGGGQSLTIANILGPSLVEEMMAGPAGERMVLNVMSRRGKDVNTILDTHK